MEQEHLSSQCDQETFELVWRRVMPESRPDCPIVLPAEPAASPAVREAPPALPAVAASAPPDRPVAGEEHNVPCLGAASAIYGGQLQQFVDRALADWRSYQALSRRAQGNSGRILSAIAADQRRHAKRLSTAYFLISGVRYWPAERPAGPASRTPFAAALRERFMAEQRSAAAYQAAAAETADPCLRQLYEELSGEADAHAWLLRGILEEL